MPSVVLVSISSLSRVPINCRKLRWHAVHVHFKGYTRECNLYLLADTVILMMQLVGEEKIVGMQC